MNSSDSEIQTSWGSREDGDKEEACPQLEHGDARTGFAQKDGEPPGSIIAAEPRAVRD
jgi:hypothetical protein